LKKESEESADEERPFKQREENDFSLHDRHTYRISPNKSTVHFFTIRLINVHAIALFSSINYNLRRDNGAETGWKRLVGAFYSLDGVNAGVD